MNKSIILSGLFAVTVSCSPSSPTRGQIGYQYPSPDLYFSGTLFEYDPNVLTVLREFAEVQNDIKEYIEDGDIEIDLGPFEDKEFISAMANYRRLAAEQEDLRRQNLVVRLDDAKASVAELSIALAESEKLKAEFESYTKEYADQIAEKKAALTVAQAEQSKLSTLIIDRTNEIIVEKKLPIEKLHPRASALSWSTSSWRDGVDLTQVSCRDDEPSLTLNRIAIDGTCVYAKRPISEVASAEYDAFLMSSLNTYIDLDKEIGEVRTYARAPTGLQGVISDLESELKNAKIIARNQTNTTLADISYKVSRTQDEVENIKAQISKYERDSANSAQLGDEYDELGYQPPSGLYSRKLVFDFTERTLNSIAEEYLTSRVAINRDGSFEGLDSSAGLLVRIVTIDQGGFKQGFYNVSDETEMEIDESGEYRFTILDSEAYRGRSSLGSNEDDEVLIDSLHFLLAYAHEKGV